MQQYKILWVDDEIELLKPHILFLENKGYEVTGVNSGADALEKIEEESFDVIFLDENMPGMSGLEVLSHIKAERPNIPVVMITKNEEEYIMEEAIGSKIADYLIKPINPNQILLSVKKILDQKRIVSEKTNSNYQQDFQKISMAFFDDMDHKDWAEIYKKLVYWDIEINETDNKSMMDVLEMQKAEANGTFTKFIKDNYADWLNNPDEDKPMLSHEIMKERVFPELKDSGDDPVFFIVVDNLRYDQWKILEPVISEYFNTEEEEPYFSILPTTTAYARNAIFSGMMPSEMEKNYPDLWLNDDEEGGKNNKEAEFLEAQLQRHRIDIRTSYHKVIHVNQGKNVLDNLHNLFANKLNVLVYNFVDMLSHARTDTEVIRELAPDEPAYRSLTKSWFQHSSLLDVLKILAEKKIKVLLTTDHGTIRCKRPYKIVGDRNTNTNLRYKQGKNLSFDKKNVFVADKPDRFFLPKLNVSTAYVFATEDHFFAYPNNYNHYVKYYKNTFQHGGVSLEEVIIPFVKLVPR
ncbi:PglZ domain-containing protein [Flammeovirgaceae bacterium SG7u.111]|nr:PglZ domain-containing protein [Flammeovirgaceae bacterium SG7u.132]WPO34916.1 PglZ domain-containing protein [Flammeovirgaceae bacterium SG7u.111]